MMRLARFLAIAGIASRRHAEELIRQGSVSVNGAVVTTVGTVVDETKDTVMYDGTQVSAEEYVYYLLNKPAGYTCSVSDVHAKKLVTALVPKSPRVYPVGRLDRETEGLLLLTNDGDLTQKLTHPKHAVKKVYEVTTERAIENEDFKALRNGVRLTEGLAKIDALQRIASNRLRITIHQGWNRQIRRMLGTRGHKVEHLIRVQEGNLRLADTATGSFRKLNKEDII